MRMYVEGNIEEFETAPEPFVSGDYRFRVESVETTGDKNGQMYHKIKSVVVEGPTARNKNGEEIDFEGRNFTDILYPPDKQHDMMPQSKDPEWKYKMHQRQLRSFLDAAEVPYDSDGANSEYDDQDFVGLEFGATLGPQRNNPDRIEVKRYF